MRDPKPPFPEQEQEPPGRDSEMRPGADHGEESYVGNGKLKDRVAEGSTIVNTTSIQAAQPSAELLHYAATKGAISTFTKGLAQELAEQGSASTASRPGRSGRRGW